MRLLLAILLVLFPCFAYANYGGGVLVEEADGTPSDFVYKQIFPSGTVDISAAVATITASPGDGDVELSWYCDDPDGITNNTVCIQAAVDAVAATGGGAVHIRKTTQPYVVGGPSLWVEMASGVSLIGHGTPVFKCFSSGDTTIYHMIEVGGANVGATKRDVTISGISFTTDGDKTSMVSGVTLDGYTDAVRIENCRFENLMYGIGITSEYAENTTIQGCRFEDCATKITDPQGDSPGAGAIFSDGQRTVITDCYFTDIGVHHTDHCIYLGSDGSNSAVSNVYGYDIAGYGVNVSSPNSAVTNSTFEECYGAIAGAGNATVAGVTCINPSHQALFLNSGITVTGCRVYGTSSVFIYMYGEGSSVTDSLFVNTDADYGVPGWIIGDKNTVKDNVFLGTGTLAYTGTNGLRITSDYNVVSGNTFIDVATDVAIWDEGDNNIILDNRITSSDGDVFHQDWIDVDGSGTILDGNVVEYITNAPATDAAINAVADAVQLRLDGTNSPTTGVIAFGDDIRSSNAADCTEATTLTIDSSAILYGGTEYVADLTDSCGTGAMLFSTDTLGTPTPICLGSDIELFSVFGTSFTPNIDIPACLLYVPDFGVGITAVLPVVGEQTCTTLASTISGAIGGATVNVTASDSDFYKWNSSTCSYSIDLETGWTRASSWPSSETITEDSEIVYTWTLDEDNGNFTTAGDVEVGGDITVTDTVSAGKVLAGNIVGLLGEVVIAGAHQYTATESSGFYQTFSSNTALTSTLGSPTTAAVIGTVAYASDGSSTDAFTNDVLGGVLGGYWQAEHTGSGLMTLLRAAEFRVTTYGSDSGNVTHGISLYPTATQELGSTSSFGSYDGILIEPHPDSPAVITGDRVGVHIGDLDEGANNYGILIEEFTDTTNDWGIWSDSRAGFGDDIGLYFGGTPDDPNDPTDIILSSSTAGQLTLTPTVADTDVAMYFNGTTNHGTITYMEDEDRFDFGDPVKFTGTHYGTGAKTATYTALLTDDVIICSPAADMDIDLPQASTATGKEYTIKKVNSSAYTVTIDPYDLETIDDAASYVIVVQYDSITLISDGTEWWIL